MKKKGYRFNGRQEYCYMPVNPEARSKLMERRLVALGYGIEYNMMHLFAEEGGSGLLSHFIVLVSLLPAIINL